MKDNYQSLKQVTKWALILELLLCLIFFLVFVCPKIAKAEELWKTIILDKNNTSIYNTSNKEDIWNAKFAVKT